MRHPLLLGLLALAACVADPVGPGGPRPGGQVRFIISVADTGTIDRDGYVLRYGENSLPVHRRGLSFIHPELPAGPLTARLDSLESWCTADPAEQTVEVIADAMTDIQFAVGCAQMYGTARVIVSSTMVDDPDPNGYVVSGPQGPVATSVNDTVDVPVPARVSSTVGLTGFAPWCQSAQPERQVAPDVGDTVVVTINVGCGTAYANARLLATIAGDAPADDTIRVRLVGGTTQTLPAGVAKDFLVRRDRPWVLIEAVPASCVNLSQDSIGLQPAVGGPPGTTTEIGVGCGTVTAFATAFPGGPSERISVGLDGTGLQVTGTGLQGVTLPALSPDRSSLIGTQQLFDAGTGQWRYTLVLQPAQGGPVQFPQAGSPEDSAWRYPSWNHDGTRLIGHIQTPAGPVLHVGFDLDGTALDTLALPAGTMPGAVESPDGQLIAFFRVLPGGGGGLVIARTSDLVQIEFYPASGDGTTIAWSPDGGRLAFAGASSIWVLSRATGVATRLAFPPDLADDTAPQWSSDGKLIFFRRYHCCTVDPFSRPAVVQSTGGRVREIITRRIWGGPY